jgi:hypothetical protein
VVRRRAHRHALRAFGLATVGIVAWHFPCRVHAQVYEINGGNSSLYQAGGGSLSVHAQGYDAAVGAGIIGGHFTYGGNVRRQIGDSLVIAGDNELDMLFPTDVFSASHYLYARGMGVKTKINGFDITAFGGTTSSLYETPLFEGAGSGDGMGFVSLHQTMSPKWQIWTDALYSDRRMTDLIAVQWAPAHNFRLAATGGVGANEPYGAVSINLSRKYVDVLGSYISAGPDFRRVVVSSPIQAEPDKGNILVTVRPARFMTLSGGAQSYQVPDLTTHTNIASGVRNASATLRVAGAIVSGTAYDSSALGETTHAAALTASREVTRRVNVMTSYMCSKPQSSSSTSSFFSTITETLNQHISVNENVSTSNGQTSLHYGGSLLTNFLTVSAGYETFYIPVHTSSPFQQSLMLDLGIHLFGRATLHGATFVGPTGQTLYTATATAIAVRGQSSRPSDNVIAMGQSILRMQVVDDDNKPVEGAALLIDTRPVFTGPDGVFEMHERKRHVHSLKVLTDQFLDGGEWEVKSMPQAVSSNPQEGDPGVVVVVHRIPVARAPVEKPDTDGQEIAHEHE